MTRDVRDALVSLVGGSVWSIWLGEITSKTGEMRLGGEQFREQGEDMRSGGFIKLPQPLDQPALVYGPDLIQNDLTRLSFESNRYASGIRTPLFGHACVLAHAGWAGEMAVHGGHDNRIDVLVHFVRGDNEAGAGLADFTAFGGV